jgi:hypothetical protein
MKSKVFCVFLMLSWVVFAACSDGASADDTPDDKPPTKIQLSVLYNSNFTGKLAGVTIHSSLTDNDFIASDEQKITATLVTFKPKTKANPAVYWTGTGDYYVVITIGEGADKAVYVQVKPGSELKADLSNVIKCNITTITKTTLLTHFKKVDNPPPGLLLNLGAETTP